MSAMLQDAVSEALGTFSGQWVDVHEHDHDGERNWTGRLERAIEGHDPGGGSVVRLIFDGPSTGQPNATLEFTGAATSTASFGRDSFDPRERLTIIEAGSEGPRRVVVARRGEMPDPEPPAALVSTERDRAQVSSALSMFLHRWRGHEVLVRDDRGAHSHEFGGRLHSVEVSSAGWIIPLGEHRLEIFADTAGGTSSERTDTSQTLTIYDQGAPIILRVVADEESDDTEAF